MLKVPEDPQASFTGETPNARPEKLLTLLAAAHELGLPAFKIRRAAQRGLFPTYSILNGRRLVRLSEVIAAIDRSATTAVTTN